MPAAAKTRLLPGVLAWTRPENGTCWPRAGSPWLLFSDRHCCSPPSGNQSAATRRAQALAWAPSVAGRSSARQEAALIGPIERQIEFGKARRSELDGLPAVQDHLDQLGAQKGEVDQAPNIAAGDAVALGQLPQRSGASGGKLLEPGTPARDRLDQRGVTSRAVVLHCHSRQHQPHFNTTAPEGHGRCKLDWAIARVLR